MFFRRPQFWILDPPLSNPPHAPVDHLIVWVMTARTQGRRTVVKSRGVANLREKREGARTIYILFFLHIWIHQMYVYTGNCVVLYCICGPCAKAINMLLTHRHSQGWGRNPHSIFLLHAFNLRHGTHILIARRNNICRP